MPLPFAQIVCVDCGGDCYPLNWHADEGEGPAGEVIAYRCRDCMDRWDVVMSDREDPGV